VANTGAASATIVDARRHAVTATVGVGAGPSHVAFDPDGECAYVACSGSNDVAVLAPARHEVIGTIAAGAAL
jgi:YVTN family beta-propeller protein